MSDADRKELAEMEPMIKEALEHEQIFMHNPALRREYEAREKAMRDEKSRIETAKEEGIEEERVRQEQKQMKQILNLMKNMSIDLEEAMKALEMTEEDKKVYRRLINS